MSDPTDRLPPPPPPPRPEPSTPPPLRPAQRPTPQEESALSKQLRSVRPDLPVLRWAWIVLGSLIAVPLVLLGAFQLVTLLAHDEEDVQLTFDRAGIEVLDVSVDMGTIEVIGTDTSTITVNAHISNGIKETDHREVVRDGRLFLESRCQHFLSKFCSVDYTVEVPRDLAINTHTSNSRIELTDLAADVRAQTDSGSIRARSLSGVVDLRTDNGSISGELSSSDVGVGTDNGSIQLTFTRPPMRVDARTDNGTVLIVVPDTQDTYATDLANDNGNTRSDVRTDPSSPRTIYARTDNGSITVRYPK